MVEQEELYSDEVLPHGKRKARIVTNGLIIVWTNKLLSTEPYLVIEIGCSEAKECIHLIMRPLVRLPIKL
jgi:hypothetical protein